MANDSPASILFDVNGNPVGVILEGSIYKLQAQITGAAPEGAAIVGNPVQIAGKDTFGKIRTFQVDLEGGQQLSVKDESSSNMLRLILSELKKVSFLLSQMSDISLDDGDLDE